MESGILECLHPGMGVSPLRVARRASFTAAVWASFALVARARRIIPQSFPTTLALSLPFFFLFGGMHAFSMPALCSVSAPPAALCLPSLLATLLWPLLVPAAPSSQRSCTYACRCSCGCALSVAGVLVPALSSCAHWGCACCSRVASSSCTFSSCSCWLFQRLGGRVHARACCTSSEICSEHAGSTHERVRSSQDSYGAAPPVTDVGLPGAFETFETFEDFRIPEPQKCTRVHF